MSKPRSVARCVTQTGRKSAIRNASVVRCDRRFVVRETGAKCARKHSIFDRLELRSVRSHIARPDSRCAPSFVCPAPWLLRPCVRRHHGQALARAPVSMSRPPQRRKAPRLTLTHSLVAEYSQKYRRGYVILLRGKIHHLRVEVIEEMKSELLEVRQGEIKTIEASSTNAETNDNDETEPVAT